MDMSSRIGSVMSISGRICEKWGSVGHRTRGLTERTNKRLDHDVRELTLEQLLLGGDVGVTGLLPQTCGTALEQHWRVRLGDGTAEESDDTGEDHVDPYHPPPADGLTDEAADDGAEHRAAVGSRSEQGNRKATLVVVPYVGNRATSKRQRSRREDATEESTDQERLDILRDGAGDVEDDVDDTGDDPNGSTANEFALYQILAMLKVTDERRVTNQWCPDEWTDTETTHHQTDTQRNNNNANIEFFLNIFKITGNNRTGKCSGNDRNGTDSGNP